MTQGPTNPHEASRLRQVQAAWHASKGNIIRSDLRSLGRSARVFIVNTQDLLVTVEWFENSLANPLMQPSKRRELLEFGFQVALLFQNAITAGQSFLEHCDRTVMRRYRGHPFEVEFRARFGGLITDSPVCAFVESLRGFVLHSESMQPVFSTRLVDFSDPLDSMQSIGLSTEGLRREWAKARDRRAKEQAKRAEQYLSLLSERDINIRRLVYSYVAVLREFGDWLLSRLREIEADALAEAATLYDELVELVGANARSWLEAAAAHDDVASWFDIH